MKNFFVLLLSLLLCTGSVFGQTHVMSMTTANNNGGNNIFVLEAAVDNTPIQIDFGDGNLVDTTIGTQEFLFSNDLTGSTYVKIYGNGIVTFQVSDELLSLDVSGNPDLLELNCDFNKLTVLDLSHNTSLRSLNCESNQLTSLDVSQNPGLTTLRCANNAIDELDVTLQPNLGYLACENNLLEAIDVRNNPKLRVLFCQNNYLNFATLPLRQPSFEMFTYAPQRSVSIPDHAAIGEIIDLSRLFRIDQIVTSFTWKKRDGKPLNLGEDYVMTGGITVFFMDPGDSVYCVMQNRNFNDLSGDEVLQTNKVHLAGQATAVVMRTKKETGDIVTMTMRANSPATQVEIDFGNGQPETFLLDTAAVAISHVVTGSHNLVVYGNHITSVDVSHNELTDLFVNPDLPLHWFDCSDNLLTGLHVNPEFILQSFFCYNNLFDFSTLPVPRNGWLNYVYAPQHPLEVQPGAEGTEVDLNSQFQVNRIPTLFTWKTKNGNILLENTDYVIANGITTFVSNQPDSVFCEISNPVFCGFVSPDVFQTCMVKVNETEPQMTFAPYLQLCQACSIYPVSFFVRADDENTPIQVDFGDGTLVDILIGKTDTLIEHTVGYKPDLQIIVYGKGISSFRLNNPVISEIDVTANPFLKDLSCGNTLLTKVDLQRNRLLTKLDVTNSSISSLDLHKNLLLQLLHCSNNHLKYLDISNNLALESLDCSLNQLDKIHLFSLENLDTLICTNNVLLALDVTRNPSLSYLQCSGNQLTQLDVTQNKLLTNLTCSFNEIEYIDLKDNALLTEFDCSQNQLNVLDVSRNPNLAYLGCSFNLLTALNLKQNPLLRTFRCVSNALTQLDFSNNDSLKIIDVTFNRIESLELTDMKALTSLSVIENNLTELDLSQNANLTECWYYGNRLTFATLPVPQENWVFCVYAPQQPVFIESGITTGDSIDFSNQFLVREDTTVFVWKDATGNLLIVGTDYMIQNGVTRFLKARIDSVYCEMTNPVFPHFTGDFILKTTKTSISKLTGTTVTEGSEPIILYDNRRCYVRSSFPGEIRIFDITGRLVYRSVLQSGLNEVRPGPSGAYLVTVIGNSSSWSGKIVVD